jgi:hypothetical protein
VRVKQVFVYIGKRAAIVGVFTFFVTLPIIGSNLGDKKPDVHLFVLALIDAAFFAILSLLFPIRKKKVLRLRDA